MYPQSCEQEIADLVGSIAKNVVDAMDYVSSTRQASWLVPAIGIARFATIIYVISKGCPN